jgi:N-methylhydantoinase A
MTQDSGYRLGVDVGGTFTDLVLVAPDGRALTRKVLSTTADYAEAIIRGTTALLADAGLSPDAVREVIHGTTVATNAILERRGARTGLITTAGFRDLLEIGRSTVPALRSDFGARCRWSRGLPARGRRAHDARGPGAHAAR